MSGGQIAAQRAPKIGRATARIGRFVTIRTLLAVVAFVYFIAFASFGLQASGLVGSHGILPVGEYLTAMRAEGGSEVFWDVPTLLWINASDGALQALWMAGCLAALIAMATRWQRPALAACLVLWISVCSIGQEFLSFQWDVLLIETGFLTLFADASALRLFPFRWLVFRLMFLSGLVKLLSRDPAWRDLTALHFHYETQPLPLPLAWYIYQLPMGFQKASTAFVFVAELLVPFLFFAPRRWRRLGAWITILLQLLILTTGNYTYFNLLTIILTMWLFVDPDPTERSQRHRVVSLAFVAVVILLGGLVFAETFSINPPGGGELMHLVEPLHIVNSYGLFSVMTTTRNEIIVEGSNDGDHWQAYEFRYKPGDVYRMPPIVAPHQPRLDWQMWFAALGTYQQNRWFVNFLLRLLQGEPSVLKLMRYNPFPNAPPHYIRARMFVYHFTHWGDKAWWTREERGDYFPAVSLK